MPMSDKHALELWWDDTDGGRVTADKPTQSLSAFIRSCEQKGMGVRKIAEELTARTGGRFVVGHTAVHRWQQRMREGLPLG